MQKGPLLFRLFNRGECESSRKTRFQWTAGVPPALVQTSHSLRARRPRSISAPPNFARKKFPLLLFSRLTGDDGERGTVLLRENNGCFAAKTQTFSSVLARLFAGCQSPATCAKIIGIIGVLRAAIAKFFFAFIPRV